jgi:hypothetical protein
MALTFLQSDLRFDLAGSSDSSPITPILRSPLWDFRPSFNPKSWSSGTASVPSSTFMQIMIESTDQKRRRTARPRPHGQTHATHPIPAASSPKDCRPNSTKRTAFCLRSAQNLRLKCSASLTAGCAWTRFQKNSSRASTHVATPFAGIASAATSRRR